MDITVRQALKADLPAISEIYNDAVLTLTASYSYEPETLNERRLWFDDHQREGYPVITAVDATGQVVGWGSLNDFRGRYGYRFTAENSVYVRTDLQGKGIGKLLLSALIDAARELGLHAIVAGIDSEGIASIRLHEQFGFVRVGHLKEVGYKFDRWLDVIFMELLI